MTANFNPKQKLLLSTVALTFALAGTATALPYDDHENAHKNPETLMGLYDKLEGRYACSGANSRGNETSATITITKQSGGDMLHYHHQNTGSNSNQMVGMWSYDANVKNLVVSRNYISPNGNYFDLLVGDEWSEDKLVFELIESLAPLQMNYRFVYDVPNENSFKVTWEVLRDGEWTMGDYSNCSAI